VPAAPYHHLNNEIEWGLSWYHVTCCGANLVPTMAPTKSAESYEHPKPYPKRAWCCSKLQQARGSQPSKMDAMKLEQPNLQKWGIKALRWWGERCDSFRNKMAHSKTNRNKWSHRMFHYVRTTVRKYKNSPAKNHQLNHLNQLTNRIRIIRNWGPNQASFPGSQYGLPRALHLVAKCVGTNHKQVFFSRFTEFNASHL